MAAAAASNGVAARIGAIYPDDAWVDRETQALVDDFSAYLTPNVELIAASTPVASLDAIYENSLALAENGDIEEAARRLSKYDPDCFAYYCTTVSFIRGTGGDEEIARRITTATGKPATTTSTAMVEAFRRLGIKSVALASPYMPDVEAKFVAFIEGHGVTVLNSRALNLKEGHSTVPPDEISQLAEGADLPQADAVFIGCTGQRLATRIDEMERRLGKPVLTANQVTTWHALELAGEQPTLRGRGRLFASS